MTEENRTCPKCGSEMKTGFLIDLTHKNPAVEIAEQMEWVEGDSAERTAIMGGIKLSGKDRRKVITCCCDGCGHLESYAVK
jgi:hypothetical protein